MRRLIEKSWLNRGAVAIFLWPLSVIYQTVMLSRLYAYNKGWIKSYAVDAPLVVVGNISVGGTGKTPLVIWLVNQLKQAGYRPGIISRGYRREGENNTLLIDDSVEISQTGDEAALMYQHTGVPIALGADRVAAARTLLQQSQCNVIVSDDGYQHLRLKRDFNIVVVDGMRGFGNGWCLPAGFLREPLSALKRTNAIVINGEASGKLQNCLQEYEPCKMQLNLSQLRCLNDGLNRKISDFHQQTVHAVAGIGNPARFFQSLKQHDINIIEHAFIDHHDFKEADLAFDDEHLIIMTEKDAVKCQLFSEQLKQRIWVAHATIEVDDCLIDKVINVIGEHA